MKYVIIRCEDYARASSDTTPLLEGAKTVHLQHLAQAGAAGVIRRQPHEMLVDRFQLHRALFGLAPNDPEAAPARCYAAGANVPLAAGEIGWCCELITHRDGRIIDATAGDIPTKESEVLIRAINNQLGSETRHWAVGDGSHHLLVLRDTSLKTPQEGRGCSSELLIGQDWKRSLPKGSARAPLQALIEQVSNILETHPVNRVRVDLGENPANLIWLWGAARGESQVSFHERTGLSGAVVSHRFPMRGFASCLGLDWRSGPTSLEEAPLRQLLKGTAALIERRDVVYVHLRIEDSDPVERLCVMERVDQLLLKPLTELLPSHGPWRVLVVVDDYLTGSVPWIAIGTGLPQHPVAHLDAQALAESTLVYEDGVALFSWFTQQ